MSVNPSLVVGNVNFNSILYTDYTLRYVGIETTTPNYTLTVNGNAYIEDDLYVANSAIVYQNMSVLNDLFVENNATINDNLYVLGCVGIGTNVANYTLTVDGIEYNERVKVGTQVLLFTPPNYWQQIAVFSDTAFLTASYVCNYESTYSDICGNGKIIVNMRDTGFGASNTTFNLIQTDTANGGPAIDDGYIVTNGGNVEIWVHYKTNIFSYIRVVSETFGGSITPSMGITTPSSTFTDAGFATYLGTVSVFLRAQIFPQVRATGIGTTNTNTNFLVSGRVGIGSTTPIYSLDVNGISRTTNLLVKDGQPDNVFTVGTCFAPAAALAFNTSDTSLVNHSAALSLANYDITDNSSVFISFDSKNGSGEFVSGAQIAAKFVAHPNGGGYPNTDLVFTTVSSTSQATERLRIASSGNIGINTSVPNNTLTVNGNAYIADNLIVQNTVFIENSVTLNDNLYVLGCVGIGSTTPTTKFDIVGNNLSGYISKIENTNAEGFGLLIQVNHDGDTDKPMLMLQNATNEYFAVKGAGPSYFLGSGVGIGTTNPAYKLDVYDSIRANTNLLVNSTNLFDFTGYTVNGSFTAVATQSAMAINYTKTSSLIETPAVLTLRNVKQDSVTPSSSEPIQVPLRFAVFDGDTGGSTVGIGQISALCTGRTANNFAVGDLAFLVGRQSSNAGLNEVMRIASNGNVGIGITNPAYQLHLSTDNAAKLTTNTWTTTSDMRVKEDIETADYNLCEELMNQLELRYYKYKDNIPGFENVTDRHRLGWIAQEVEKVFPKSVTTIDKQGELENFKMLNTDQIYAMMFGTIKKLIKDKEQILKELQEIQNKMKVLG